MVFQNAHRTEHESVHTFVWCQHRPKTYPPPPSRHSVSARAMTGRLESVDLLVASAIFLGHTTSPWVGANALLTVAGVVLAVAYPTLGGQADQHSHGLLGYFFLVAGGWGYTLSLIITKRFLVHIPVGLLSLFKVWGDGWTKDKDTILVVARLLTDRHYSYTPLGLKSKSKQLALGTVLFHAISSLQHHTGQGEMDLYSWPLWRSMLWYAPLFVTSTMVLWLRALKLCSPAVLSIGMNSNFVVRVRSFGRVLLDCWRCCIVLFVLRVETVRCIQGLSFWVLA